MFDDLRNDATTGSTEETKPNQPYVNPELDAFDRILKTVEFGTRRNASKILDEDKIELLGPDELLDWPFHKKKGASNCDKGIFISKYLRPAVLPIHDSLLKSAKETDTNWLDDLGKVDELPSWFTTRNEDELVVQNGLPESPFDTINSQDEEPKPVEKRANKEDELPDWPKVIRELPHAKRVEIPDWMPDHDPDKVDDDVNLSEFKWDPEVNSEKDDKKFDPNKTQKVKAYNKQKRAYITLVVLILYFAFTLFAGSFFTFRVDEMISSLLGVYLYTIAQEHGYDLKFLLPHKK